MPSGPWITPCGAEPSPSGTSRTSPVAMSMMPSVPRRCRVYQICPSGPGATSCGCDPAGTSNTIASTLAIWLVPVVSPLDCACAQPDVIAATKPIIAAGIRIAAPSAFRLDSLARLDVSVNAQQFLQDVSGYPDLLIHRFEEVFVGLRILHLVEQEFHRVDRAHLHQDPAQHPHLREAILLDQQFFLAGAGLADIEQIGRAHV